MDDEVVVDHIVDVDDDGGGGVADAVVLCQYRAPVMPNVVVDNLDATIDVVVVVVDG